MVTRRDTAAEQVRRGLAAFPCGTPSGRHGHGPGSNSECETCKAEKAPRRGWMWKQRHSRDPVVIEQHWPADDPNIGIPCLASRAVVIDLDTPAHGGVIPEAWQLPGIVEGADVLAYLLEQQGQSWPQTYTVRTASGGLHLYFRAIDGRPIPNSAGKVGPMIDVRGDGNSDGTPGGGYVVGAGSVVGGVTYEVIDDSPLLQLPQWLADLAAPVKNAATRGPVRSVGLPAGRTHTRFVGLLDTILQAPRGQRNNVLHWAACRAAEMVHEGHVDRQAALAALAQAAESIGLGDRETQTTIASAFGGAAA